MHPPSMARGLAGKRVDAYLAGIIPINFIIKCALLSNVFCKNTKRFGNVVYFDLICGSIQLNYDGNSMSYIIRFQYRRR